MDMDTIQLPHDFREFIQFINSTGVEYLLVGGYAVAFHGSPRFTADMDIWIREGEDNAVKLGKALEQFGFRDPEIASGRFFAAHTLFRMGRPPMQIDIMTEISGCDFADCYSRRQVVSRDGIEISMISLDDLKQNKRAAGRSKDLGDLEELE